MIPHKTISNNFENGQKQASKYSRSSPLRVFRQVVKCRGVSTNVGLEISALPRFAASDNNISN